MKPFDFPLRAGLSTVFLAAFLAACGGGGGSSGTPDGTDGGSGGGSNHGGDDGGTPSAPVSYSLSLDVSGLPEDGQVAYTYNGVEQVLAANGSGVALTVQEGDVLALAQASFGETATSLFSCSFGDAGLGTLAAGKLTLAAGDEDVSQPVRCETVKLAVQPLAAVTYGINSDPYYCLSASLVSSIPCGFGVLKVDPATAQASWLKYQPAAEGASPQVLGASQAYGNYSANYAQDAAIFKGELYFPAYAANYKTELWATDGTDAGTRLVKDIRAAHRTLGSQPGGFASIGDGKLYFRADDGAVALYETDGTEAGTHRVAIEGEQGSTGYGLLAAEQKLFFFGTVSTRTAYDLIRLKEVDGAQQVDILVRGDAGYKPDSDFLAVADQGGKKVVISAWHEKLLAEDASFASPKRLRVVDVENETIATVTDRVGQFGQYGWLYGNQYAVGADGFVYFIGHTEASGYQLWKTDGTDANTIQLTSLAGNTTAASAPRHITATSGLVYFTAQDETHGRELWVTDGTVAGTRLVDDIFPGAAQGEAFASGLYAGEPNRVFAAGNRVVFMASSTGQTPQAVWTAEEGVASRVIPASAANSDNASDAKHLSGLGSKVLYTKRLNADAPFQNTFWLTDGTAAGTQQVTDEQGQELTTTSAN